MRSLKLHISTILLAVGLVSQSSAEMSVELNYLSSYSTGFYNAGGAEIASYDPETQRVFLTGAADNAVTIVDISNPDSPELVTMIDLDAYGAGVNSVTVKNGIVAAAVEASPKTDPGMVVFFNRLVTSSTPLESAHSPTW